jgi:hypothetical protein
MTGKQTFTTLDYGDKPFRVEVTDEVVSVYDNYDLIRNGKKKWEKLVQKNLLTISSYEQIFIGTDSNYGPKGDGNSMLVKKSDNEYIYIGNQIYSFETTDEIQSYHSTIGNSSVPYPYAIGTDNTYLMIESVKISNEKLKSRDPYNYYYDVKKHVNNNDFKKFNTNIIQKRLWHDCSHADA